MVEGFAHISLHAVTDTIRLTPLEIAGIMADRAGLTEVDAEPTGNGNQWRIRASNADGKAQVAVTGGSLHEAVSKLVERLR